MTYTLVNEKAMELTLMAKNSGLLKDDLCYAIYADMFVKQLCIKKRFGGLTVVKDFTTFKDMYYYILDMMDEIRYYNLYGCFPKH